LKKLNKHLFRQALDALAAPALIVDADGRDRSIVFANGAAGQLLGLHPNELTGLCIDSLVADKPDPGQAPVWRLRSKGGMVLDLRAVPLYEQPGRASYWLLTTPGRDRVPVQEAAAGSAFTATDTFARLPRDERIDATTGVPGRTAMQETLQRDWAIARRDQRRITMMVFRIDALESYQHLFGRHATDTCLRRVAHVIANALQRAGDYCARVGNDRFGVLVGGADDDQATRFAERIAQRVRDLSIHHPRSQLARYVTVSYAIAAEIPPTGGEEPGLLEEAEARLGCGAMPREVDPATDKGVSSLG